MPDTGLMDVADEDAHSTRRQPGRPRLPFERIVATAREIVDADGVSALTMRSLAGQLNTSPTVLYRAVAGRAELIEHVVDHTLAEIHVDFDDGATWQTDCLISAQAMFAVLSRHRGVAPLLIERVPIGPHALLMRERILARLLDHGFTPAEASMAYATLARYVIGFAAQLDGHSGAREREADRLTSLYRDLDGAALPATVAVAEHLPQQTLESEFEFGLHLLITGLANHRQADGSPRSEPLVTEPRQRGTGDVFPSVVDRE
ncbi:TetR/AcrR family transcriptional regulator [Gordonia hankookensis]|nr:TetR/AcrR family transcriptional regulator C-terminal domain-containing protein [Gordonia hankookensis]